MEGDAYLKGILLGYGDSNTQYFCQRCVVKKYFNTTSKVKLYFYIENLPGIFLPVSRPQPRRYAMIKPQPSPGFASLEAEQEWIEKVQWDLEKEREATPPYFVALPLYICRHGGDSEMIREKYRRARVKLAKLFYGKSYRQAVEDEVRRK